MRHLAPSPPKIHSFVYQCPSDELRGFANSLEFVFVLLNAQVAGPMDEVVACFLQQASISYPEPEQFLVRAGKQVAVVLGNQSQRLNNLLQRLSP